MDISLRQDRPLALPGQGTVALLSLASSRGLAKDYSCGRCHTGRWRGSICNGLATEDEEHSPEKTEKARRGARGHPCALGEPVKHDGAYSPPALGEYAPSQDEASAARVRRGALTPALMMPHPSTLFVTDA